MKVKTENKLPEMEETTAMTTTGAGAMMTLDGGGTMQADAPGAGFLPGCRVIYPVDSQNDPANIKTNMIWKLALFAGEKVVTLDKPYKIIALASRNASREIVVAVDPQTKKEKVSYVRAYGEYLGNKASHALYLEHVAKAQSEKKRFKTGASYVVAILTEAGVVMAVIDAVGRASHNYFNRLFAQANWPNKLIASVTVIDHSDNTKANDAGSFLDSDKFTQFSCAPLTEAELSAIKAAFAENQDGLAQWCKK